MLLCGAAVIWGSGSIGGACIRTSIRDIAGIIRVVQDGSVLRIICLFVNGCSIGRICGVICAVFCIAYICVIVCAFVFCIVGLIIAAAEQVFEESYDFVPEAFLFFCLRIDGIQRAVYYSICAENVILGIVNDAAIARITGEEAFDGTPESCKEALVLAFQILQGLL